MTEPSKVPKSSLKNPQSVKRPAESRRVTFMSPKPSSPKQQRLLFGTSSPMNKGNTEQQIPTPRNIVAGSPIPGDEVFNQVLMLQMKAISLREENLWQIVDVASKVKRAILQITEEDRALYQIDGRLNDHAAKLAAKTQKIQEDVQHVEYARDATRKLRAKFLALRSAK